MTWVAVTAPDPYSSQIGLIFAGAAVAHLGLEMFPEGHAFEVEIDDTEEDSAAFCLAVGVHF